MVELSPGEWRVAVKLVFWKSANSTILLCIWRSSTVSSTLVM